MKQILNNAYNPLDLAEINRKKLEARHRGTSNETDRRSFHTPGAPTKQTSTTASSSAASHGTADASMAEMFMGMLLTPTQNEESGQSMPACSELVDKPAQEAGTNPKFFLLKSQEQSNQQTVEASGCTQFEIHNPYLGKVVLVVRSQPSGLSVSIQAKHSLNKQQAHTLIQLVRAGLKSALNIEHLEVRID
ncbi:MAG TPA: hypothetical protein VFV39_01910 [Limnobacter sp.]|nr:hypothetical protein [Limnobacter sp.]